MDPSACSYSLAGNGTGSGEDPCGGNKPMAELQWYHVAIASTLILTNGLLSIALGLRLERRMFISAIRCVVQLTIMGMVLQHIFDAKNPVLVLMMALLLITLAAYEVNFNATKRRHVYMFPSVLISMGASSLIIGVFGTRLAMGINPLRTPKEFIPALGMLIGNTMTATAIGLDICLKQLTENKEKIELYLSMGATRWEACRPVAVEAMRTALMPTINQMSIIGLISIPGMMTGQLMAGASVMNAVKSQQIIMFLITGSASFGCLSSVMICLRVCFDSSDRLRPERISKTQSIVPKGVQDFVGRIGSWLGETLCCCWYNKQQSRAASPSLEQGGSGRRTPRMNGSPRQRHQQPGSASPVGSASVPTERTPLVRSG